MNRIITAFDTFQASIGWFQFIRRRAHNWNLNQCPTSKLATFAEFNISLSLDVKFQYRKKVLVHWNAMTIFTWDETVCVKHLQLLFSHICIVSIQIIFTFLLMCGTVTVTGKFMIGLSKDNKNVINNSKKKTLNENCHWNGQHFERWEEKNTIRNIKKGCHSQLRYVWNCKLHSSDGWVFYLWPFTASIDFLHIFSLSVVICTRIQSSRWFVFFFDHFLLEENVYKKFANIQKKRKLQRKIINCFLWLAQENFSVKHFIVEWIHHLNGYNGFQQMSNPLNIQSVEIIKRFFVLGNRFFLFVCCFFQSIGHKSRCADHINRPNESNELIAFYWISWPVHRNVSQESFIWCLLCKRV